MSDSWGDAAGIEGNYEDDANKNGSDETSGKDESNVVKTNIKDEWNGRTIYIPDDILNELENTYLESQLKLRNAGQDEFKKNRHFYPLLVQFGLEALANADADEIQSRLSEIHDE